MANDYGVIIIHETRDFRGGIEHRDYVWKGGPITRISDNVIDTLHLKEWPKEGDIIQIGPFRLVLVEYEPWILSGLYARIDNPVNWLRYFWHRLTRTLDIAYRRFIVTLSVWRLAEFRNYSIPTLDDIYAVKKVKKIWQMIIARLQR